MSQPTTYTPAHEFLEDEGANPNFPGSEIDIELNALERTTDEIISNLSLIQRADGQLQNGIVSADALDTVLAAALGDLEAVATVAQMVTDAEAAAVAALASQTAAGLSAGTATTQAGLSAASASSASSSASSATASASSATTSASTATTQAGLASTSATNAGTSATNAASSASAASTSAGTASTHATTATTQAGNASTSATNAAASAVAAAASAAAASVSFDSFDDRYLGPYASDPALDNDGNALVTGAIYFNTTTGLKIWNGATWLSYSAVSGDMLKSDNLSGLASAATAFANIKQAATTSATGVVELSTDAEAIAKADTARGLTPSNLAALGASDTFAGLVELATPAEAVTGIDTSRAVTPADLTAAMALNGNRLAKTAAYTVLNADKGKTIAMAGSAYYTLTFGAASGFDANFMVTLVNEDTAAGKKIAFNGLTAFLLWPGQIVIGFNSNGVWKTTGPYRWILTGAQTFYVDVTNGNDANDGLATGTGRAVKTIQQALLNIQKLVDLNGNNPTVQLAAGTYPESFVLFGAFTGGPEVTILGDNTTPSNVVWKPAINATAFHARDGAIVQITGVQFDGTNTGCTGIESSQFSVVDLTNIWFTAFTSGIVMQADDGGKINLVAGTFKFSGNFIYGIYINGGSFHVPAGITFNLPSALTFTQFVFAYRGSMSCDGSITMTGTGAGAGSTGAKYSINFNATCLANGTIFPGATAGGTGTGGQYV